MNINYHHNSCACAQCAPVPTQPLAPPPVCPDTGGCDEYIESDCVISSITAGCVGTFTDPTTGQTVPIGLNIVQNQTTLSNVYQQLTTTACILNPNVIGGILQLIQTNPMLNQIMNTIICDADCEDPCDDIVTVSQAVFTNLTDTSFDITFLAQPGYSYQITINDTTTLPVTYYTWSNPTNAPPNNSSVSPISYTLNTSVFTQFTGTPPVSSGPPSTLNPNCTHEVYITAIINNESCEEGPWTVTTAPSPACPPECDQIQLTITPDPSITTHLAFIVTFLSGPAFPQEYFINVYNSDGDNPVNGPYAISNPPAIDPITSLYPTTATPYDFPLVTDPFSYIVEVTPICSTVPIYCTGTTVIATIVLAGPSTCVPPDITSVVVTSAP